MKNEKSENTNNELTAGANADEPFAFTVEEQNVKTDLDPQLRHVITAAQSGRIDRALVQEADDGTLRVDVSAVLKDPNQPVPGLEIVQAVGNIITGTCEVDKIEAVKEHPNVQSLKGATRVQPNLRFSVPEIRGTQKAIRNALPPGSRVPDGSGVIVGVVDFGCDYVHRNFRNPDGRTRLLFLWDQQGSQNSMSPAGYPYGREFNSDHINEALRSDDPYAFLSYDPEEEAHGTHVMDTAAGNGRGTGAPGVAPKADLIFVELASEALRPDESFGNSRRLMDAVKYIFDKATQLGRPAVVNLSLGTHGGPHDGSTPVERWFDELLNVPGRAIVISAGNSHTRRSHAAGTITAGNPRTLGWEKFSTDTTSNEVEVWYSGNSQVEATLVFPGGQPIGPLRPGDNPRVIRDASGVAVGEFIHRANDSLNGDNVVNIFIGPRLPIGVWKIELGTSGAPVNFHAWIERDDDRRRPNGTIDRNQSRFIAADDDATHTIGSISCGRNTIIVGAYQPTVMQRDIAGFSSEGPTRDGKQKPEVSAPGQDILAAASRTEDGTVPMSGTSMAAPHVTGLVALTMQAANTPLPIDELRTIVIDAARRNPPPAGGWHSRYGNGRIDVAACVLATAPVLPLSVSTAAQIPEVVGDSRELLSPLSQFVNAMIDGANNASIRVKFEMDVSRQGRT